jgi:AcrR family transcriptional regulator
MVHEVGWGDGVGRPSPEATTARDHGYEGTSTDTLLKAMGISRQSVYDTFGDKWQLYQEAL